MQKNLDQKAQSEIDKWNKTNHIPITANKYRKRRKQPQSHQLQTKIKSGFSKRPICFDGQCIELTYYSM